MDPTSPSRDISIRDGNINSNNNTNHNPNNNNGYNGGNNTGNNTGNGGSTAPRKKTVGPYELVKKLGSGSYAEVFEGIDTRSPTRERYALKAIARGMLIFMIEEME